jgi:hypothetical protein
MKKGKLLVTDFGWCILTKKSNTEAVPLPVSSFLVRVNKLKSGDLVEFETTKSNIVIEIKKYTPVKSFKRNPLTLKPGGSNLQFVFTDCVQNQPNIKYPQVYIKKVLKELETEPKFLLEVWEGEDLIWEGGNFTR